MVVFRSDKARFDHSGHPEVNVTRQNCVVILFQWTQFMYHVGSYDYRSIVGGGLVAGGSQQRERQTSGLVCGRGPDDQANIVFCISM